MGFRVLAEDSVLVTMLVSTEQDELSISDEQFAAMAHEYVVVVCFIRPDLLFVDVSRGFRSFKVLR